MRLNTQAEKEKGAKTKSKTAFTIALALLLFLMMFTALHIPPAKAQPTPVFPLSPQPLVYVDPSTITANAGQQFNISVYVNSTVELDLYGFQINMTWANGILNYESATWGAPWQAVWHPYTRALLIGGMAFPAGVPPSYVAVDSTTSPLLLFTVTFQGISAGTSPINLINVELFGKSDDGNGWPPSNFPSSTSTFNGIPEFTSYDRWPNPANTSSIGIPDALVLWNAFGSTPGARNWNPACDFNEDGVVDTFDCLILWGNFYLSNESLRWPGTDPAYASTYPNGLTNTIFEFNETVQDGSAYVTDDWPMFHHDISHTGYSTSTGPTTNQTLWIYPTGGAVESSPAVVNGLVYVGSGSRSAPYSGNVYCLNAASGAFVWSYPAGVWASSPAVAGGLVYVGSTDGYFHCLNATTGALVWSFSGGGWWWESSPAVVGGSVYVGCDSGYVYCLNAYTGTQVWSFKTGYYVSSSPAVAGGLVYVGSWDNNTYCLNATSGALVWSFPTQAYVESSPAVVGGLVYVGSEDGNVYCLDAANGALVWRFTTGGSPSSPAVVGGVVYVGSTNNNVYALDAATGALIWNWTTGDAVESSPAVVGGFVYVGSYDGYFYCLNATSGAFVWSYTTGTYVYSSPAVVNGVVYVGSDNGNVYAFGTRAPSSASVVCSPNSVSVGSPVTCTATVSGSNPTGTVTWSTSSSTGNFSQSVCTLSSGTCSTTYTDTSTAYATITASYSGDSNNLPSTGSTILTVFVNLPTGTNVTVNPTSNLELTFANVTAAGIVVANETPTVPAPPLDPFGWYYNVNVTAGFSGNVTVGWAFNGSNMTLQQKSSLQMMEYTPIPGNIVTPFGQVDMGDIMTILYAFGSTPTNWLKANWNPVCDLEGNGKIDMGDVVIALRNFGETAKWINITLYVDTTNNIIYGQTTHFSFITVH